MKATLRLWYRRWRARREILRLVDDIIKTYPAQVPVRGERNRWTRHFWKLMEARIKAKGG